MIQAKTLTIRIWLGLLISASGALADANVRDWTHEADELATETVDESSTASETEVFTAPVSWDSFIAQLSNSKFIKWGLAWGGVTPYEKNAQASTTMSPASVQKILTSTTALRVLGPDFRFANSFQAQIDEVNGAASGVEFSISGDPTWAHAAYGETLLTRMKSVTDQLVKNGVKILTGEIKITSTQPRLAQHERPEQWKQSWLLACYATLPSPVILNGNCASFKITAANKAVWTTSGVSTPLDVKLTKARTTAVEVAPILDDYGRVARYEIRGSFATAVTYTVPVQNNIGWFKTLFITALSQAGIRYEEKKPTEKHSLRIRTANLFVDLSSKTLREILSPFLEQSINLIGDRLYLEVAYHLGSVKTEDPQLQSLIEVTHDPLAATGAVALDGSGLIAADQMAVKTLRAYLSGLREQTYFNDFLHALPVAGKTGTLKSRLTGAGTKGKVFAKTGTIDGVANLAGYFQKADLSYEPFVVFTHSNLAASTVRTQMDKIVTEFARQNASLR